MNFQKSALYYSKHISSQRVNRLQLLLGCTVQQFPFTYLGAPIYRGRCKASYFDPLIQKILRKIEGWTAKFLSFAGKMTLVKSVLTSLQLHTLSCTAVPKAVVLRIERAIKSLLWNKNGAQRLHWLNWNKVCLPFQEGGLGIRSIADTIKGLQGKLAWNIMTGTSLWSKLLMQKYGRGRIFDPGTQQNASKLWKELQPHFQSLQNMHQWIVGKGNFSFWRDNWTG